MLDEQVRSLVGGSGLTVKYAALAAQLGVGEEAVRRAAKRLVKAGHIAATPAGRQGVRLSPAGHGKAPAGRPRAAAPGRARASSRASFCPICGRKALTDWTYCAACGKRLPQLSD